MKDEVRGHNGPLSLHPSSFIPHPFLVGVPVLCGRCGLPPGAVRRRRFNSGPLGVIPSDRRPGAFAPGPAPLSAGPSSWPLMRGDARASGVAGSALPDKMELLWTFSTAKGGFESTAAILDGVVYAASTGGILYAITLADGKKRWELAVPTGFNASPAVRGGRVYIGDVDGLFYCIDAAGRKLWEFPTDGEIDSSANFHGGHVLFGSQDSFLYCLDAASGKLVWKYQSGDQIRCFPTVLDDLGFVAGCDG